MFTFLAHQIPHDGYGYASQKISEAFDWLGAGVQQIDMANGHGAQQRVGQWIVNGYAIAFCHPSWWADIFAERLIGFTMFETTRLPDELVRIINAYAVRCIVPSTFCQVAFENSGVNVPLSVVPLAVDAEKDYPLLDRQEHYGPYTFLWSGTPDFRKGWDLVYRAFWAAFEGRADVQLVMHFREMPHGVQGCRDANVRIVAGKLSHEAWLGLLQETDCFVFPSRGEGYGLLPREAAATGLPVIATDWGGLRDGIQQWAMPLRVAGLAGAAFGNWERGQAGDWAMPDFEHLVHLMRWCAKNKDVAAETGKRAAAWLRLNATWTATARGLLEVIARETSVSGIGA